MDTPQTGKFSWSRMRGAVRHALTLVIAPERLSVAGSDRDPDCASIKGSVKPSSELKSIAINILPSRVLPSAPSTIAESSARENEATKGDSPLMAPSPLFQSQNVSPQTSPPHAPELEAIQISPEGYTPLSWIDSTTTDFTEDVDQPQVVRDPFAQQPALPHGNPSSPAAPMPAGSKADYNLAIPRPPAPESLHFLRTSYDKANANDRSSDLILQPQERDEAEAIQEELRKKDEEVRKRETEVRKHEEEVRTHEEEVKKREEEVRKSEEEVSMREEEVRKSEEEVRKRAEEAKAPEAGQKNEALDINVVCARLFILLQAPESFKKFVDLQNEQAQEMMNLLQKVRLAFPPTSYLYKYSYDS